MAVEFVTMPNVLQWYMAGREVENVQFVRGAPAKSIRRLTPLDHGKSVLLRPRSFFVAGSLALSAACLVTFEKSTDIYVK